MTTDLNLNCFLGIYVEQVNGIMENGEENPCWLVGDGTVDYKGQPADKRRTGGWKSAPLIFGTVISSSREQFNPCNAKVGVPIMGTSNSTKKKFLGH